MKPGLQKVPWALYIGRCLACKHWYYNLAPFEREIIETTCDCDWKPEPMVDGPATPEQPEVRRVLMRAEGFIPPHLADELTCTKETRELWAGILANNLIKLRLEQQQQPPEEGPNGTETKAEQDHQAQGHRNAAGRAQGRQRPGRAGRAGRRRRGRRDRR